MGNFLSISKGKSRSQADYSEQVAFSPKTPLKNGRQHTLESKEAIERKISSAAKAPMIEIANDNDRYAPKIPLKGSKGFEK